MSLPHASTAGDWDNEGTETAPCGLCGDPAPATVTPRCARCWQLEGAIQADPKLAAKIIGAIFGRIKSKARTKAARENGKLGGRPRKMKV